MSIGKNIRKARQEADMTQEQLAELLNISVSAVSQWESDKTTPDISMIPALCNVFQMTSDKLLDIELEKNEEEIEAIRAEASKFSTRGKGSEAMDILKEGLKKFPSSYEIMYDLMYIAYLASHQEGESKKNKERHREQAIWYAERIIQDSKDDSLRSGAKQVLCMVHADAGENDKAITIAKTMDDLACCKENMLTLATKGQEKFLKGQEYIFQLIQALSGQMAAQYAVQLDDGGYPYSFEERACIIQKQIDFLHLMFENKDYGFFHEMLFRAQLEQAWYYAYKEDEEQMLQRLEQAKNHAVAFSILDKEAKYTSLLLRNIEFGDFMAFSELNTAEQMLKVMGHKHFKAFQKNARFQEIERSLQEYAGGWGKLER